MQIYTDRLFATMETVVTQHHALYATIPSQGIFFEALAEKAFHLSGSPNAHIARTTANAPTHDLIVGDERVSLKTETGRSTKPNSISITKLCTTEREPWNAETLIERTCNHLTRYDLLLMLRAIWGESEIHYQLVDIPMDLLRLTEGSKLKEVGNRKGRRSLGGDITIDGEIAFHVHYDGSDGKCQVRNLSLARCRILGEWDQRF